MCAWCRLRVEPCTAAHWSGTGLPVSDRRGPDGRGAEDDGIQVHSAVLYSGLPGEMIARLKFSGEKYLAAAASGLIVRYSRRLPSPGDVIVPVPVSRKRRRERGYNQAALIAGRLASATGTAMRELLARKHGPSQLEMSVAGRRKNVEDVFHLRGGRRLPEGKRIWLVDDVATTFSTIHSAAGSLLENGADSVTGLTLAYRRRGTGSIIRNE
ncbi:MAG: hypothetical protein R6U39_07670 [Candidatus Aegiribacteria sp.]